MVFSTSSAPKYEEIPDIDELPIPRKRRSISSILCYFSVFLVGLGLGLIIGFYSPTKSPPTARGITLGSPIPHEVFAPRIPKLFVPDERYVGSSREVNDNWKSLVKGHDTIWLGNPEKYDLGKGIKAPFEHPLNHNEPMPEQFYIISNLHQLHCVNVIRIRYWHILKDGYSPKDADAEDWLTHVDHCFEYLRLGITCGDFLVVEPDSPPGTPAALTVDGLGWGVTHNCINFDLLLSYQSSQEGLYNQTWQKNL